MKKRIIFLLATFLLMPLSVFAKPTVSINAPSTVEVGSSVTVSVTLKNMASWNIKINSSGATSGCSTSDSNVSDSTKNTTKTYTVKCKATSTGTIGFTVTGDATDEGGDTTDLSASKRVTVIPAREKSADATLSSLSISGYDLNPAFSKDKLEYSLTVPSTVNKIKINAKVNESHASLTGTGEFEVSEGANPFEVVVTAETGVKKTYVVTVNVEDTNPIEVKIENGNYTIIKNAKNLVKPESYEDTTVEIDGVSIPAFYSEITNFTLIGVKNENGNIELAIYNSETKEYRIYNELKASTITLYLVDFPEVIPKYLKATITINDVLVPVYKYKEDSRFVVCYGMNAETGKYDYYSYDTKEGTFQIWNQEVEKDLQNDLNTYLYVCIAFGIALVVSFILIISLLHKKKKNKKKIDKKMQFELNEEDKE